MGYDYCAKCGAFLKYGGDYCDKCEPAHECETCHSKFNRDRSETQCDSCYLDTHCWEPDCARDPITPANHYCLKHSSYKFCACIGKPKQADIGSYCNIYREPITNLPDSDHMMHITPFPYLYVPPQNVATANSANRICPNRSHTYKKCPRGPYPGTHCEHIISSSSSLCTQCRQQNTCVECLSVILTTSDPEPNIQSRICTWCRKYYTCLNCSQAKYSKEKRLLCEDCSQITQAIACVSCERIVRNGSIDHPRMNLPYQLCARCDIFTYWNAFSLLPKILSACARILMLSSAPVRDFATVVQVVVAAREHYESDWLTVTLMALSCRKSARILLKKQSAAIALINVYWLPNDLRCKIYGYI